MRRATDFVNQTSMAPPGSQFRVSRWLWPYKVSAERPGVSRTLHVPKVALCTAMLMMMATVVRADLVQYTITASDIAPATALSGQTTAVLRVAISNPVAGGIAKVQ